MFFIHIDIRNTNLKDYNSRSLSISIRTWNIRELGQFLCRKNYLDLLKLLQNLVYHSKKQLHSLHCIGLPRPSLYETLTFVANVSLTGDFYSLYFVPNVHQCLSATFPPPEQNVITGTKSRISHRRKSQMLSWINVWICKVTAMFGFG